MTQTNAQRPVPSPTPADVQGWVVRGYNLGHVRQVICTIHNPEPLRTFLGRATNGDPSTQQIQSGEHWGDVKPPSALNVAFTYTGLAALGVPARTLAGFPTDFSHGAPARAIKIGDVGDSAPDRWDAGTDDIDKVHVVWTIHGQQSDDIDAAWNKLAAATGSSMSVVASYDGSALADNKVHFGYVDSISQPHIESFERDNPAPDKQPVAPLGSFFLGHDSQFEDVKFDLPTPTEFVGNGTYNAFRVLEQDVFGFEAFLRRAAEETGRDPEWIAAKICGRWRNGNSLEQYPDHQGEPADPATRNDYGYPDADGSICPIGSHMRRANPRDAAIVQRAANHTRRITRRGMPYGPLIAPDQEPDDTPRGLLGNFLCGSLTAQFEGVQYDWINLGLQHPSITGTNDVLLGANEELTSRFTIPMPDGPDLVLSGFPRFVRTRASTYTFLPSIPGLRWLANAAM